jgi:hypothetical protein
LSLPSFIFNGAPRTNRDRAAFAFATVSVAASLSFPKI